MGCSSIKLELTDNLLVHGSTSMNSSKQLEDFGIFDLAVLSLVPKCCLYM